MVKENEKQIVLCLIDGSKESIVSAYLLKKQYRHVHGVYFDFTTDLGIPLLNEYFGNDRAYIEKISKKLDISIEIINSKEIFIEKFIDQLISHQLSGTFFNVKVHYANTVFSALNERAVKENYHLISSFEFVKIFKNIKNNTIDLLSSQDLENDDCFKLARLDEEILWKLIFPLAEMRRSEADKLSTLIDIELKTKKSELSLEVLFNDRDFRAYLLKKVGKTLLKLGPIMEHQSQQQLGDHQGLLFHYLGEKNNFIKKNNNPPLVNLEVFKINSENLTISLDLAKNLRVNTLSISNLIFSKSMGLDLPVIVYAYTSNNSSVVKANLYFQNNNNAIVEFESEEKMFFAKGDYVFFFAQKDRGKLLGSGIIETAGMMAKSRIIESPINKLENNEITNYENEKKNIPVSFNFY